MSDPLSAVGTAVGVLSVGIQVCQGLVNYISAVRDRNGDIEATRRRVQTLHSILDMFWRLYPELERYDKVTARILDQCLFDSRQEVAELGGLLKTLTSGNDSLHVRGKAKRLARQILYPFRQESLRKIEDKVNGVLLNLHTVTQGISLQHLSSIHIALENGILRTGKVPPFEDSSSACDTEQNTSPCELHSRATGSNASNLSGNCTSASKNQELCGSPKQGAYPPGLCGLDSFRSVDCEPPVNLISFPASSKCRICNYELTHRAIAAYGSNRQHLGVPSWTLTNCRSHAPTCPLHVLSTEVTLSLLFALWLQHTVRILLNFSLKLEIRRGSLAISPSLSFRPVVRWDAPVMQLCSFVDIYRGQWQGLIIPEKDIVAAIRRTERKILELFQEGKASPYDTTEGGLTLLHVLAMQWGYAAQVFRAHLSCSAADQVAHLVRSLADAGVPSHEQRESGETSFESFIKETPGVDGYGGSASSAPWITGSMFYSTVLELKGDHDELSSEANVPEPIHLLSLLSMRPDIVRELTISPLAKAILTRSDTNLLSALSKYPSSVLELTWGLTTLHLACAWPAGLQVLLRSGGRRFLDAEDRLGRPPFSYSCRLNCLEALRVFIREGCSFGNLSFLRIRTWELEPEVVCLLINTIAKRREALWCLAEEALPNRFTEHANIEAKALPGLKGAEITAALLDYGVDVPGFLQVTGPPQSVYDTFNVPPLHFPAIADRGFRELDSHNWIGLTPVMKALCGCSNAQLGLRYTLRFVCPVMPWLRENGFLHIAAKDALGIGLNQSTSGWHYLAVCAAREGVLGLPEPPPLLGRRTAPSIMAILSQVFTISATDQCVCWCSSRGCTPFLAFCKFWDEQIELMDNGPTSHIFDCIFQTGGEEYFAAGELLRLRQEFTRFVTFEALDLTHTCCVIDKLAIRNGDTKAYGRTTAVFETESQGKFTLPNNSGCDVYAVSVCCEDKLVREIREAETSLGGTLQSLMSEFEKYLQSYQGGVMEFIHGHWKSRMQESCRPGVEDYRAMVEVGAQFRPVFGTIMFINACEQWKPRFG